MNIEKDKWVAIHYTLTDDAGQVIDSSVGGAPLGYIHGNGYLIPGLEKQLEGKTVGDKLKAVVQPEEGYGVYDKNMVVEVDRKQFDASMGIEIGMQFQVMTPGGPAIVRVVKIEGDKITIDGNHELAGKVLNFDVEIMEVREPTEEELNPTCGCGGGCGGCGGEGGCGGDCNCDGGCGGDCNCENGGCGGEGGCGNCNN